MSDNKNDGGPAFPPTFGLSGEIGTGMTLRDWFAGQALVGLLSANAPSRSHDPHGALAMAAYAVADAMLVAREHRND